MMIFVNQESIKLVKYVQVGTRWLMIRVKKCPQLIVGIRVQVGTL